MINNNSNINFRAKYINNIQVKKRMSENVFKSIRTSFIEIDSTNANDIKVLDKVDKCWADSFASNISVLAKALHQGRCSANDFKIYALTKQVENYDSIKADDILGLVEINQTDKNKIHIDYLQTDPKQVYAAEPEYSGIGSRILDSLKNIYETITLNPNSSGVRKFYEKNDFFQTKENPKTYMWLRT